MNAPLHPRFDWGQRVQAARDLFNDGSYPEHPADSLLVREGDPGEIVQMGRQIESGAVVYMVEFALDQVIGCFEPELTPLQSRGAAQ
jgi:nitrogen fixation protein NifZ